MCLNPILRPNPWYNPGNSSRFGSLQKRIHSVGQQFMKQDEKYIYVPCGTCAACVANKQNALVQRSEVESRSHHIFFATLTYNNIHLPKLEVYVPSEDIDEGPSLFDTRVSMSAEDCEKALEDFGFDVDLDDITDERQEFEPFGSADKKVVFPYADIHHVQLLMKNLRDNLFRPERASKDSVFYGRDVKYLAVSELGKEKGRPHFHILFFVEKRDEDFAVNRLSGLRYTGSSLLQSGVIRRMEKELYEAVFKYWSVNVGTRKNPKYEKLFTFRKRFYGNQVHMNFDLHYVDPSKTTDGERNVSYYVTKYIMKGSERERRRRQFLFLNLDSVQASEVWDRIKCKMLISKGFGLNGRCVSKVSVTYSRIPLYELAELMLLDDLPADDYKQLRTKEVIKRRYMVPDPDVMSSLAANVTCDAGDKPYPTFIGSDGKHRPLAHFYSKRPEIYNLQDAMTIYYMFGDVDAVPIYEQLDVVKRKQEEHAIRLRRIEANSTFDTSAALLWNTDEDCNQEHITF